jgi:hypothetical protein
LLNFSMLRYVAVTARNYSTVNQHTSRRLRSASLCLIVTGFVVTVIGVAVAVGVTEHMRR